MANIAKRNPGGMQPWRDFLSTDNFFNNNWLRTSNTDLPDVNIAENDKNYSLEVVAPGFAKDDFKLKVDDDVLTISAETKTESNSDGKDKDYTRREYSYSSFTRSFRLPDNVKDDSISASYKDGVLDIELPKSKTEVKATKEIPVS
jgi:HSP20 family protein